jgi:hypothetical protein
LFSPSGNTGGNFNTTIGAGTFLANISAENTGAGGWGTFKRQVSVSSHPSLARTGVSVGEGDLANAHGLPKGC